ncbi:SLC26A/SulP transporter family protein [Caldimonas sp. KR1-144]|uniref:SLC26A/SulP transporter family protein n=1 Tax=Caldimonas sp. KR1-144 TaxID=3400911 RepID=UPI003C06BFBC
MSVTSPIAAHPGTRLADELAPRSLLASAAAAVILYPLVAILTLSIAALVYAGPLAPQLGQSLSGMLIGVALLVAVISLLGSYGGATGTTQDAPGVILAVGAAAAMAAMPQASPEARAATATVLMFIVTLAMGAVYMAFSVFRLGALARYLPLPVMGGFLAGTGGMLVIGGIGVAANASFGPALLEPGVMARWLPAAAVGALMLLVVRRWPHPTVLVAVCAMATVGFYGVMLALGRSPSGVEAEGWLLGPFPKDLAWRWPLDARTLAAVDWRALASALPACAPAVLIGTLALLLNTSALELVIKRNLSLDRELLVHGAANVGSALAGGLIGYTAISLSSLGHTLAGGRRLPGLVVAVLLLSTALLGTAAVAAAPRLVMGGLLMYIGSELLLEWLLRARRTMPRGDHAVVVAIFAVIVATDFLWGVAVGLVAATALFVISYSRIDVVRFELAGDRVHSRVQFGPRQRQWLQAHAGRLLVFKLQGFVFFGTASQLVDRLQLRLGPDLRFVLLDFEHVTGLDSTALLCFDKLRQHAEHHGIELVVSALRPHIERGWRELDGAACPRSFADLDHGIEWCEQRLLDDAGLGDSQADAPLRDQLLALVPDAPRVDALLARMASREVATGETIIREGDPSDAIFIVESGQFTAQLERDGAGAAVRLETMRAGSLIGEIGFVLDARRSASVVADRDSVVRSLDREAWHRLADEEPQLARFLDALLLRLVALRAVRLTRVVEGLQR